MKGPSISEREKLEKRAKWLERSLVIAGVIVVAGLIGESKTVSSILVTTGVFSEVALGIFITRTAERIQELANTAIASTMERSAKLEKQAADLQIAVADARERQAKAEETIEILRERHKPRSITPQQREFIIEKLKWLPGQQLIFEIDPTDEESGNLYRQLRETLEASQWRVALGGSAGVSVLGINLRLGGAIVNMDQIALLTLAGTLISCRLHVESAPWITDVSNGPRKGGWITMTIGRNV